MRSQSSRFFCYGCTFEFCNRNKFLLSQTYKICDIFSDESSVGKDYVPRSCRTSDEASLVLEMRGVTAPWLVYRTPVARGPVPPGSWPRTPWLVYRTPWSTPWFDRTRRRARAFIRPRRGGFRVVVVRCTSALVVARLRVPYRNELATALSVLHATARLS